MRCLPRLGLQHIRFQAHPEIWGTKDKGSNGVSRQVAQLALSPVLLLQNTVLMPGLPRYHVATASRCRLLGYTKADLA